jgi:Holliday junction resolvase RusA-like endonuclease
MTRPATVDKRRIANATFTVELPRPPTSNTLFVHNRKTNGRYPSPAYKAWRAEAAMMLLAQRPRCAVGPVELTITVQEIARYPSDIDNRIKATIDCLVENGIIDGDTAKTVRSITAKWGDVIGALVEIRPAPEWVMRKNAP